MKKKLNSISLTAAIFSIFAVVFTTISLVIELANFDITKILDSMSAFIAIPFAIMELSNGINIIKLRKEENNIKELNPVFGLLNSIVYGAALIKVTESLQDGSLADLVSSKNGFNLIAVLGMVLAIVLLIISVLDNRILRKKEYGKIAKLGVILAILTAVYFAVFLEIWTQPLIELIGDLLNLIIVILVLVYCINAKKYYIDNADIIEKSNLLSEDFDVVENKNGKTKIKVYASRGDNSFITAMFAFLGTILLIAGLILVIIYASRYVMSAMKLDDMNILYLLLPIFMQCLNIFESIIVLINALRVFIGLVAHKTMGIARTPLLAKARTIALITFATELITPIMSVIEGGDIMSLLNAENTVAVILFIIPTVLSLVSAQTYNKYNDCIRNGGSLADEKAAFGLTNILYFLSSLPLLAYPLIQHYVGGIYKTGIVFLVISFVMFIIFGICYIKRPLPETFNKKVKGNIKDVQK